MSTSPISLTLKSNLISFEIESEARKGIFKNGEFVTHYSSPLTGFPSKVCQNFVNLITLVLENVNTTK